MTTKINLLPWRNALREQRKKAFITQLAISGVLGALAVFGGWTYFSQQLSEQQEVNQMITQENAKLDEQLKALEGLDARRAQIEERMKLIEGLQGQRPVIVRVADELVRLIPQDLYVTKFQRQGDKFIIEGKAQDPNIVAELLRGLELSPWFRNAFMSSYVAADEKAVSANVNDNSQNPNQRTSLVERPETKYGTFIITVDLEQPKPAEPPVEGAEPKDPALPPADATQPQPAPQGTPQQPAPQQPTPAQQGQPTPAQQPAPQAPAQQGQQGVPTTEPVPPPQPVMVDSGAPGATPQPTGTPPAAGTPPAPANNPGVAQ